MRQPRVIALLLLCLCTLPLAAQTAKPKISFDEFFNSVSFPAVAVSPDGNSIVFETEKADWDQQIFSRELWLYRISTDGGTLVQLTQSGRDSEPQWSPDSKWIAFLSERKGSSGKDAGAGDDDKAEDGASQLYLISPNGGEAFPITSGSEEVHSFAWSADSQAIYFATREPWNKQQSDDHKKEWKDVVRYRADERGDIVFRLSLQDIQLHRELASHETPESEKDRNSTLGATVVSRTPLRVEQISVSRDGKRAAFVTNSVSQRQEKIGDVEIYLLDLGSRDETAPKILTHNEAVELNLQWAPDHRHIFFQVNLGSVDKKYEDPQPRLYWVDADTGNSQRWFSDFMGEVVHYRVLPDGSALCACRVGTEVALYTQTSPTMPIKKVQGWPGTYESPASGVHSGRIAFGFSATDRPTELYLADGVDKIDQARAITAFNRLFTERDLPKAKPYRWTSNDGTPIEGMLMYPPGGFEAKNLPMLVLIHGGPQDADGNRFEADWYQWDRLAAGSGWLVFEPNYRGSTGYGDKFALAIVPEAFSGPSRDILAGVDSLVKDGIADPNHLAVGGYSYGGYLTNWLITQTTRFKAAVTGAGGIENVADWGNDDSTFDDAYFLGGTPWQVPSRYDSEAAIFQINKVRTPTHMVAGGDDIRVPTLEAYLLDHALHQLNVPSELLIFPGEGHSLAKNPWHGKIKVREELRWLEKYGSDSQR